MRFNAQKKSYKTYPPNQNAAIEEKIAWI